MILYEVRVAVAIWLFVPYAQTSFRILLSPSLNQLSGNPMKKEYKTIILPRLPKQLIFPIMKQDTIVRSDDNGKRVTKRNFKTVLKNILKLYKR